MTMRRFLLLSVALVLALLGWCYWTAIADPVVRDKFSELGAEAVASTPEELARFISAEIVKWRDIITKAGITPQ
jgi:hypothetical protein